LATASDKSAFAYDSVDRVRSTTMRCVVDEALETAEKNGVGIWILIHEWLNPG